MEITYVNQKKITWEENAEIQSEHRHPHKELAEVTLVALGCTLGAWCM